jgi:hypothetical protein
LNVADRGALYLGVAAVLAAAAYILTTQDVQAEDTSSSGASGSSSMNGFGINNPLNLRYLSTNAYNGQTGNHNGYGVYSTLSAGVRAAGLQLSKDVQNGFTTITTLITSWAPPSENDTAAYISDVSSRAGIAACEPLSWPEDEVAIIQAMAYHENGYNPMSDSDVAQYIAS